MNRKQLMDSEASGALMRHEAGHSPPPPDLEESAPNLFASLWRHRWWVLGFTIVFVIGAVVFLRVMPPSYTVTSQITIEPPKNNIQFGGGVTASPDASGDGYLWTQVAVMQSPAVCDAAAKRITPLANDEELHHLSNTLANNLNCDVGHKDSVVSLSYTDKNADDAAINVNAIRDAYIDNATRTHGDSSREMRDELLNEKKKTDDQLRNARDAEADFKKSHPDITYTTGANGSNVYATELAKLFDTQSTEKIALMRANASLNAADAVKDDLRKLLQQAAQQQPPFLGSPATAQAIANDSAILSAAQARLMQYRGDLGTGNPFYQRDANLVKEMTAAIQGFQQQLGEEYLAYLQGQKLQCEEEVKAINEQIKSSENDIALQAQNQDLADYSKLENEVAAIVKLDDELDSTIKNLGIIADVGSPNINILRKGRGEDAVRSPQPSRVLVLTMVVGLAFGVGFALIRDKLDQRVRSAEEIAARLGLPVIGVVPHMKRGLTPLARAQAVHWDPMSEVSEAYRAVRTAVHFGVPAGQARTIVITSPTPGDGKSTLASNLAISMAQAGKHTLLLDADFRRPVQHRMFELKDESGLTAVLAGHDSLSKAIRRTVVEGLDLLPAGPLPLNPSELLNGESFASILEELSQKYDHIVLDCPPVIAVTDARILGAVCDISLLVLRAGKTTRQGAELARSGLMSVGSRLLGVIVNDVPRGEELYGYYGSYAYQSGNGNSPARIADESSGSANGHSSARRRRLPSPSGVDSM